MIAASIPFANSTIVPPDAFPDAFSLSSFAAMIAKATIPAVPNKIIVDVVRVNNNRDTSNLSYLLFVFYITASERIEINTITKSIKKDKVLAIVNNVFTIAVLNSITELSLFAVSHKPINKTMPHKIASVMTKQNNSRIISILDTPCYSFKPSGHIFVTSHLFMNCI